MHVLEVEIDDEQRLVLTVELGQLEAACPTCRVLAVSHGRRVRMLHDMPCFGRVTLLRWLVRIWRCREPQCANQTFSEAHGLAPPRMALTVRGQIKSGEFAPVPVREQMIPKRGGKLRALGIPTAADRVVQAALKLVLEPIFEADFLPCSYGFRPKRRPRTRSLRSTCWVPTPTNGCWTPTSRPVLMRSPTRR
jgi:hypothetical protein